MATIILNPNFASSFFFKFQRWRRVWILGTPNMIVIVFFFLLFVAHESYMVDKFIEKPSTSTMLWVVLTTEQKKPIPPTSGCC